MGGDAITPIPTSGDTDAEVPGQPGAEPPEMAVSPTMTDAGDDSPPAGGGGTEFPKQISHYKVVREIGAGGMGHVLKCLDTTLNRYVALKILRMGLAKNATFIERFRREAHAVAKLRHPNIVQIYSIGDDADFDFFTMEYVDGEGLDRLLARRKRLKEREALQTMLEVCLGLQEAHDSDILHRDIKPGNVLINSDGRAQLSDFGLAKFVYQQTLKVSEDAHAAGAGKNDGSMTDPGRVMGTPFYMAPELIQGREADARTEVPFKKETVDEIFDAHLAELPPPIAELNPEVSLETAKICYRALEKEPRARYQSAAEMGEALQAALDKERRAQEMQARAQLGAEMATAFGSARIGAGGGASRMGPIVGKLIMLALFVGLLLLLVEGMKMPESGPTIPGSAIMDSAWNSGSDCRVAGIVGDIEETNVQVRVALDNPDGRRWLRIPRKRWDAMGATVPSLDTWWAAEGRIVRNADGLNEMEVAKDKLWPAGALDRQRLAQDSEVMELVKFERVKDWEARSVGRRVGLTGTVMWRGTEGEKGPVKLLIARGDDAVRVFIPRPVADQSRLFHRIRMGERVAVVGRLAELEEGDDPLLEPRDQLTVEAPKEIQHQKR